MTGHRHTRSRTWQWMLLLCTAVALVAAGFWAGKVTTRPIDVPQTQQQTQIIVTAKSATVGRTLNLNVTVTQEFVPVAVNTLGGVVNSVTSKTTYTNGDELYRVANVPVRVVVGTEPFYRDMAEGTQGSDVRQLQQALTALGFLAAEPGGSFDTATAAAVRTWQNQLGMAPTGQVRLGELIAVPELPAVLQRDTKITIGAVLSGGEVAAAARRGQPQFSLVLSSDQARLVPQGAAVDVIYQGLTWTAVTGTAKPTRDSANTTIALAAADGGIVCGQQCHKLPDQATTNLLSRVHVVPATTGIVIPAAAVSTDVNQQAWVKLADGRPAQVTITASADGNVVVTGIEAGQRLIVLGPAATGTSPSEAVSSAGP